MNRTKKAEPLLTCLIVIQNYRSQYLFQREVGFVEAAIIKFKVQYITITSPSFIGLPVIDILVGSKVIMQ